MACHIANKRRGGTVFETQSSVLGAFNVYLIVACPYLAAFASYSYKRAPTVVRETRPIDRAERTGR